MSKDKRQLRAEAVERLEKLRGIGYNWADIIEAMIAERDPSYTVVSQLIDLLTDDEIPDGDAVGIMRKAKKGGFVGAIGHVMGNAKVLLGINPESGFDSVVFGTLADMIERDYVRREYYYERVKELGAERDRWPETFHDDFYDCESTVDAGEQDSREKLETDILKWLHIDKGDVHDGFDIGRQSLRDRVFGYIDRQAAITKAEQREWWGDVVAELTTERDKLREKVRHQSRQLTDTQNALEKRNEEIKPRWKRDTKKLQSRIDALTAERDEWKAKAAEEAANAEGHWRNANNIAEECAARARALDMQLKNIHNLEAERDELRRQVSELRELNDSLHARIESAREALS